MDENLISKAIYAPESYDRQNMDQNLTTGKIWTRILRQANYGPESYFDRQNMNQNLIVIGEIWTRILFHRQYMD